MNFKQENEVLVLQVPFWFWPYNWLQLGLKIQGAAREAESSLSKRLMEMETCVVELEFKEWKMIRRLCDILNYK